MVEVEIKVSYVTRLTVVLPKPISYMEFGVGSIILVPIINQFFLSTYLIYFALHPNVKESKKMYLVKNSIETNLAQNP